MRMKKIIRKKKMLFAGNTTDLGKEAKEYLERTSYVYRLTGGNFQRGAFTHVLFSILPSLFLQLTNCLTSDLRLRMDNDGNILSEYLVRHPCPIVNSRYDLVLMYINIGEYAHENALIIDNASKTIERYEPHGSETTWYNVTKFENNLKELLSKYYPNYRYLPITITCQYTNGIQGRITGPFCFTYTFLYLYLRALHQNMSSHTIYKMLNDIPVSEIYDVIDALATFAVNYGLQHDIFTQKEINSFLQLPPKYTGLMGSYASHIFLNIKQKHSFPYNRAIVTLSNIAQFSSSTSSSLDKLLASAYKTSNPDLTLFNEINANAFVNEQGLPNSVFWDWLESMITPTNFPEIFLFTVDNSTGLHKDTDYINDSYQLTQSSDPKAIISALRGKKFANDMTITENLALGNYVALTVRPIMNEPHNLVTILSPTLLVTE